MCTMGHPMPNTVHECDRGHLNSPFPFFNSDNHGKVPPFWLLTPITVIFNLEDFSLAFAHRLSIFLARGIDFLHHHFYARGFVFHTACHHFHTLRLVFHPDCHHFLARSIDFHTVIFIPKLCLSCRLAPISYPRTDIHSNLCHFYIFDTKPHAVLISMCMSPDTILMLTFHPKDRFTLHFSTPNPRTFCLVFFNSEPEVFLLSIFQLRIRGPFTLHFPTPSPKIFTLCLPNSKTKNLRNINSVCHHFHIRRAIRTPKRVNATFCRQAILSHSFLCIWHQSPLICSLLTPRTVCKLQNPRFLHSSILSDLFPSYLSFLLSLDIIFHPRPLFLDSEGFLDPGHRFLVTVTIFSNTDRRCLGSSFVLGGMVFCR